MYNVTPLKAMVVEALVIHHDYFFPGEFDPLLVHKQISPTGGGDGDDYGRGGGGGGRGGGGGAFDGVGSDEIGGEGDVVSGRGGGGGSGRLGGPPPPLFDALPDYDADHYGLGVGGVGMGGVGGVGMGGVGDGDDFLDGRRFYSRENEIRARRTFNGVVVGNNNNNVGKNNNNGNTNGVAATLDDGNNDGMGRQGNHNINNNSKDSTENAIRNGSNANYMAVDNEVICQS